MNIRLSCERVRAQEPRRQAEELMLPTTFAPMPVDDEFSGTISHSELFLECIVKSQAKIGVLQTTSRPGVESVRPTANYVRS